MTGSGAGEQQVRDSHAGSEQHEAGENQKRRKRLPKPPAQVVHPPAGGCEFDVIEILPPGLRRDRDLRHIRLEQRVGFGLGSFRPDAQLQARHDIQPPGSVIGEDYRVGEHHRYGDIDWATRLKRHHFGGHHADNRVWNFSADDVSASAEALQPVRAADDHHPSVRAALSDRLVVGGGEASAEDGRNAEKVVEIARNIDAANQFAASVDHHLHVGRAESGHALEARVAAPQEVEIGVRRAAV